MINNVRNCSKEAAQGPYNAQTSPNSETGDEAGADINHINQRSDGAWKRDHSAHMPLTYRV